MTSRWTIDPTIVANNAAKHSRVMVNSGATLSYIHKNAAIPAVNVPKAFFGEMRYCVTSSYIARLGRICSNEELGRVSIAPPQRPDAQEIQHAYGVLKGP